MMLRKSHSTDWNVPGTNNKSMMEAAPIVSEGHALAVQRHFDELKRIDLTELQSSFEAWASTKRQVLTEDKSSYLKTLSEEADTVEALKKQLATLVARRQAIVTALQEEQTEYDQGLAANEELEVQREALSSRLKALKDESKRVTSTLIAEEAELEKREELHRRKIARERLEISLSEEHLGLTVDAVGDDERLVRFCFTRIDPTDWNRRFVIVLDVSASRSRVVSCDPPVPSLSRLLQTLNGDGLSGHLCRFLSELRSEFVSVALSVKT